MTPGINYVFTPRIVRQPRLGTLNDVSPMEMTSSLLTASLNGVMLTNYSEYQIRIRTGEQLERAQELEYRDRIHGKKPVVDWADRIRPTATTRHSIGSRAESPSFLYEVTPTHLGLFSFAVMVIPPTHKDYVSFDKRGHEKPRSPPVTTVHHRASDTEINYGRSHPAYLRAGHPEMTE